jgi:hypothetical protein
MRHICARFAENEGLTGSVIRPVRPLAGNCNRVYMGDCKAGWNLKVWGKYHKISAWPLEMTCKNVYSELTNQL